MHPDLIAERLQQFESLCRRLGVPLTVQRRVVLQAVLEMRDHPTADQIIDVVNDRVPGISRTTVYRVLDTLVEMGVVRRLHHPGAAVRYDGKVHRHHHLICKNCHKVIDVDSAALDRLPPPVEGIQDFAIEDFSVHFLGVCAECRQVATASTAEPT
jgi:Fur family peroxide stress response transcriptional regulator